MQMVGTPSAAMDAGDGSYRLLFAASPLPSWVYDLHTLAFLDVNDAVVARYGYSREELLRMGRADIDQQDASSTTSQHTRLPTADAEDDGVRQHRLKGGRLIDVVTAVQPVRFGGRDAALEVIQDVTALVRGEAEQMARLRRQQADEAAAMSAVSAALFSTLHLPRLCEVILEQAGKVLPWDHAAVLLYEDGWATVAASQGRCTVPSGTRPFQVADMPDLAATGAAGRPARISDTAELDHWIAVPPFTGTTTIRSVLVVPITVGTRVVGTFNVDSFVPHFFTERHLATAVAFGERLAQAWHNAWLFGAEQAARARAEHVEANLAAIIAASPWPIVTLDPQGIVKSWNKAAERTLWWSAEETIGHYVPMIPPELQPELGLQPEQFESGGGFPDREVRGQRKDGSTLDLLLTAAPLRDLTGSFSGVIALFTDITARKQAEAFIAASERRYRALIDHAPDAILVVDVDTNRLVDANTKAEQLFECSREELLSGDLLRFYADIQPDSLSAYESIHRYHARALAGEDLLMEQLIVSASGTSKVCEGRVVQLPPDGHRLLRASYVDITARRRMEEAHRRLDHQFREILRLAPVGTVILAHRGTIEYANDAFAALHEYTVDTLIGRSIADLVPADRREGLTAQYDDYLSATDGIARNVETVTRTGALRTLQVASVQFEGLDGRPRRASFAVDRTEQQRTELQLVYSATHDPLTGLPNRVQFHERLAQELGRASRQHGAVAVLQIDLNRFKVVNDTLGHAAGDAVLTTVARRMREALRVEDIVARLGGDEFAVVLPGSDEQSAALVAEKLCARVREPIEVDQGSVDVDVSVGITVYPHHADEPAELMRGADLAMYIAKAHGGGVAVYSSELEEHSVQSRTLLQDLHLAADRGQLRLYFQPVMETEGGSVVRAEALLRWQHPTLGLLRLRHFLPAAGLSDTMDRVTLWVLDEALQQCRSWQESGMAVGVEVNLALLHAI